MKEAAVQRCEYSPHRVYFAARDGMLYSLCHSLDGMDQQQLQEVLKTVSITRSLKN